MGEDYDAVLQREFARTLKGVNMGGTAGAGQPAFVAFDRFASRSRRFSWLMRWLRVSASRCGLLDLHPGIAVDVLEPFGRVAGSVLDFQHLHAAARLVN